MGWLRRLFSRKRLEADLDKELRFHIESQVADKIGSGIPESEARRLTRMNFGGIEQSAWRWVHHAGAWRGTRFWKALRCL